MGRGICYYNVSPYSWIINQTIKDPLIDRSKIEHHYYVNMFHYSPTMVEERPKEINVVNLDELSFELPKEIQTFPNLTQ